MSYLRKGVKTFQVFLPDNIFCSSEEKYDDFEVPIILHAPSSPFIKGTPLVRAAISRLRAEGYVFQYVEHSNLSNNSLLEVMRKTHIVLNEFYAFVPGMLGIEALANKCVLVTRSSKNLEPTLPGRTDLAWISSEPYEVYDVVRSLLDDSKSWLSQARQGFEWAREHASEAHQGRLFANTLKSLLISNS
jgi:hypothetical protein